MDIPGIAADSFVLVFDAKNSIRQSETDPEEICWTFAPDPKEVRFNTGEFEGQIAYIVSDMKLCIYRADASSGKPACYLRWYFDLDNRWNSRRPRGCKIHFISGQGKVLVSLEIGDMEWACGKFDEQVLGRDFDCKYFDFIAMAAVEIENPTSWVQC